MNATNANTFAIVQTKDIAQLAKERATAAASLVYVSLLSFARDKVCCFPSIETLSRSLGGAYSKRTIYRALEWLCQKGFVKRQEKSSKERWTIVSRLVDRTKKVLEKLSKPKKPYAAKNDTPHYSAKNDTIKETQKKSSFKKVRSNLPSWRVSGNYERFERPDNAYENDAQKAWSDFAYAVWPPNLYKATESQKKLLCREILHGSSLDWAVEQHPHIKQQARELYTEAL